MPVFCFKATLSISCRSLAQRSARRLRCLMEVVQFQLCSPFSAISFEMLIRLVHEGPDGRLPSGLEAGVVGGIQVWNSQLVHKRPYDG